MSMVLIMNLLLPVVTLGGLLLAWKLKKWWPVVAIMVFFIFYQKVQPSYLPKGQIIRSDIPAFEQSEAVIEDRLSKPKSPEQLDFELNEKIQKGLPFNGSNEEKDNSADGKIID